MAQLKTYSHLAGARRVPSEYELVTSRLLYHPKQGFEVQVPLADWHRRYQADSPLACSDWERFHDPRATTYTLYTALQSRQEAQVEGLLQSIDDRGYDAALPARARALLLRAVSPLRFAFHGLQMAAAYVGQVAPCGRVAVAALFQAADELRRVQRVAYRIAQLRRALPDFAAVDGESRALWQTDPAWQPLRRAIERLLVTWDWGEALVALNVCLKPAIDAVTMVDVPAMAHDAGDYLLGEICFSLAADCAWHRAWTDALLATAVADRPENAAIVEGWRQTWAPAADEAAGALRAMAREAAR